MKKYFSSGFFLNLKSSVLAIQRNQPELLGVSEQQTAHETKHYPPSRPGPQITVFKSCSPEFDDSGGKTQLVEIHPLKVIQQQRDPSKLNVMLAQVQNLFSWQLDHVYG